jgi:hypothetical protein
MWASRVLESKFKETAIKAGVTTEEELKTISEAFTEFAKDQDGWFTVVNGEVVCRK